MEQVEGGVERLVTEKIKERKEVEKVIG